MMKRLAVPVVVFGLLAGLSGGVQSQSQQMRHGALIAGSCEAVILAKTPPGPAEDSTPMTSSDVAKRWPFEVGQCHVARREYKAALSPLLDVAAQVFDSKISLTNQQYAALYYDIALAYYKTGQAAKALPFIDEAMTSLSYVSASVARNMNSLYSELHRNDVLQESDLSSTLLSIDCPSLKNGFYRIESVGYFIEYHGRSREALSKLAEAYLEQAQNYGACATKYSSKPYIAAWSFDNAGKNWLVGSACEQIAAPGENLNHLLQAGRDAFRSGMGALNSSHYSAGSYAELMRALRADSEATFGCP